MSLIGGITNTIGDVKDGNFLTNLLFGSKGGSEMKLQNYFDLDAYNFIDSLLHTPDAFNNSLAFADDPTVMGFKLKISLSDPLFYVPREESNEDGSKKSRKPDYKPSAYNYLMNINQVERANKLAKFVERFDYLIGQRNYFLQKMTGLSNIYKVDPKISFTERVITFQTLESIDLYISSMIDDYCRSTYDYRELKQIVPVNLLYFDLVIVINEIRQFKTFLNKTKANRGLIEASEGRGKSDSYAILNKANQDKDGMIYLNEHLGVHCLKFEDCLFDFSDGNEYLGSLDNAAPAIINNKFKIKLGRLDFHLTDLDVFSTSKNKINAIDSYIVHPYNEKDLRGDNAVRRFTKEPENSPGKKGIGGMLADLAKKEAEKAARAIVGGIDRQLGNTATLLESKVKTAAGQMINQYRPANLASRLVNGTLQKGMSKVNNGLNNLIDNISGNGDMMDIPDLLINKEGDSAQKSLIDQMRAENKGKKESHNPKDNISSRRSTMTPEEMERTNNLISSSEIADEIVDEDVEKMTDGEKLRKDVARMIIHGQSFDQYMKESLAAASRQSIT